MQVEARQREQMTYEQYQRYQEEQQRRGAGQAAAPLAPGPSTAVGDVRSPVGVRDSDASMVALRTLADQQRAHEAAIRAMHAHLQVRMTARGDSPTVCVVVQVLVVQGLPICMARRLSLSPYIAWPYTSSQARRCLDSCETHPTWVSFRLQATAAQGAPNAQYQQALQVQVRVADYLLTAVSATLRQPLQRAAQAPLPPTPQHPFLPLFLSLQMQQMLQQLAVVQHQMAALHQQTSAALMARQGPASDHAQNLQRVQVADLQRKQRALLEASDSMTVTAMGRDALAGLLTRP